VLDTAQSRTIMPGTHISVRLRGVVCSWWLWGLGLTSRKKACSGWQRWQRWQCADGGHVTEVRQLSVRPSAPSCNNTKYNSRPVRSTKYNTTISASLWGSTFYSGSQFSIQVDRYRWCCTVQPVLYETKHHLEKVLGSWTGSMPTTSTTSLYS